MTALMTRRGPDDEGHWSDEHLSLGFRRLAILDLSDAGHQPMLSACGGYALVYNGEVYNFRELRRDLEAQGSSFRSQTDTEVVLEALIRWGHEALPKLNGMFALAFYDLRNRSLLLARDPLGIKPLNYLVHSEGLVFGSQYNQIVQHPWCNSSRLDTEVLGLYLRLGYVPAPYGLIKNTYQLKPGHSLRIRPGEEPSIECFYCFPSSEEQSLVGADAEEAVAHATQRAVQRQTISDVPIGTFLSGGVDSPLVAAAMQMASSRPVPAVTIGSTDPKLDETEIARAYARQFDLDHTVRVFDERDAADYVKTVADAFSEPFADPSAFPSLMLSQVTRERMKVVLSGDGGDELFWGYPRFQKLLHARHYFHLPRPLRTALYAAGRVTGRSTPPRGVRQPSLGAWYLDGHSGLHTADLELVCPAAVSVPPSFQTYTLRGVPTEFDLAQWMRQAELECHLPMILLKMDRASMHFGLEVRVPLLDLEVLECAARVPPSECIRGGVGKLPLRAALARYVPPHTIPRRKAGFDIPMAQWLRGALRPQVEDLLLNRNPYPSGLFDRTALRRLYATHLEGHDRQRGLWTLLALQLWAERHVAALPGAPISALAIA
jgi:asparagine synthase (glutamine-hydrolysing)